MEQLQNSTISRKIFFAGLGGQGVIFLNRLYARAAVKLGYNVIGSETHGMSQRGGSVTSHLKIGDKQAPLIQKGGADILIALDLDEAVRYLAFLREGGILLVATDREPQSELASYLQTLSIRVLFLNLNEIFSKLGNAARINIVMSGFALPHLELPFSLSLIQEIVDEMAPKESESNRRAVELGLQISQQYGQAARVPGFVSQI